MAPIDAGSSCHGSPPVDCSEDIPLEQPRSPIARSGQVGSVTLSRRSKRAAIKRWRQERERPTHQFVGVLRHTERADAAWDSSNPWTQSEDFVAWPHDPPLSDNGLQAAKQIGQQIRSEVEKAGTILHIVVCSPFLRCVQTAVEVCCELGAGTRLLIDATLGEVFSPNVMGSLDLDGKINLVRPFEEILDICSKRGVACECYSVGQAPESPETLRSARRRFALRFLTYLKRSLKVRRNFLIVSHADCVGAALSMMPSECGSIVEKVDYGGMFLAQRPIQQRSQMEIDSPVSRFRHRQSTCPVRLEALEPFSPRLEDLSSEENPDNILQTPPGTPRMNDRAASDGFVQPLYNDGDAEPPQDMDGWQVNSYCVSRACTEHLGALERRLNDFVVDGSFSRLSIERLLHVNLSDHPLGQCAKAQTRPIPKRLASWLSDPSSQLSHDSATTRNSTLLFGKGRSHLDLTQIPSDKSGEKHSSSDKNTKKSKASKLTDEKQGNLVDEGSPSKQVTLSKAFSLNSANSRIFQRRKSTA